MGILTSLLTGRPIRATYADHDDFWYTPDPRFGAGATEAGYPVSPEGALRLGAVYACVGLIADMVGVLPLILYRHLDNDGKEKARTHPLYNLLRRRPNQRQTAKEWRTMGTAHLLLRGNFYNEIVFDGRLAITELRPMHPDRVTVTLLDSGRRGYVYRPPRGPQRVFTQDEIFHVMGLSLDGVVGCSVIEYARESISSAHAQEGFAARFWAQGAEGHLAFVAPNALSEPVRKANEEALQRRIGGWQQAHKAILLEGGLKPERISASGRDSQYLESRNFGVADIARFFRVSPDMIGHNDGTSTWGTGIEARMRGFVDFTLMPWLVSIEQAVDRDLLDDASGALFAEFLVDALLRGEMAARATTYAAYVMNGIMSENEVRVRENLNPYPGLDEPRRSANQDRGEDPRQVRPPGPPERPRRRPPPDEVDDEDEARAWPIVVTAATRVVGKEIAAVRKWHARLGASPEAWRAWAAKFYGDHVDTLTRTLCLDQAAARQVCASHFAALMERGLGVLDEWDSQAPDALAALALGQEATNGHRA